MKKFSLFFVLMMMSAVAFTAVASDSIRGDVNRDGRVNIADVTCLINYLLNHNAPDTVSSAADCNQRGYVLLQKTSDFDLAAADCNLDGNINIADVTTTISRLLRQKWPDPLRGYVDLGLPSGTLWATDNIGAATADTWGTYFAWGEVDGGIFDWEHYKWCVDGDMANLTKYCTKSYLGIVDDKTELDPEDDAAYVQWGPAWRMPTREQQQELVDYCSWQWSFRHGVYGYLLTAPNDSTLFLPAGGYYNGTTCSGFNEMGLYWSRSLLEMNPSFANYLFFDSNSRSAQGSTYRAFGNSIRAVRATKD